uniref:Putative terminase n=1 Tax=viral metagenome TaxID=1070528 RepID=A0A6M3JB72_9ZZZZ
MTSPARFKVVAAGRRSGKTERGKQEGVVLATAIQEVEEDWFVFLAPTRDQAKRIFWEDVKGLVPTWAVARKYEGDLVLRLWNTANVAVVGMDRPQRIEGIPIRWFLFDEYGEARPDAWTSTLRPAVSTIGREGSGWFIGRPKGRNHFHRLFHYARARAAECLAADEVPDWDAFHWRSSEILSPEEIAAAKRDLDPLSYAQEYDAEFVSFEGRVYYAFDADVHAAERIGYDPTKPIAICLDFNVRPGVAAYVQEQFYVGRRTAVAANVTAVVGEVWIPRDSTTSSVCRRIVADLGPNGRISRRPDGHEGEVLMYGDATGGAKGSAKVAGSDWDIVRQELHPTFGARLKFRVPKANPRERVRVNAVNRRLLAADGTVSMLVDPVEAPHVVVDLEGVTWREGAVDEIDKRGDSDLTHVSDALGYYVARRWPISLGGGGTVTRL